MAIESFSSKPEGLGIVHKIGLVVVFVVRVITLSILTYKRNQVWHDSETLWKDVLQKYPQAYLAYNNLGVYYCTKGKFKDAITVQLKALQLLPENAEAHFNLGVSFYKNGSL